MVNDKVHYIVYPIAIYENQKTKRGGCPAAFFYFF